jgi:hypothetical protein
METSGGRLGGWEDYKVWAFVSVSFYVKYRGLVAYLAEGSLCRYSPGSRFQDKILFPVPARLG